MALVFSVMHLYTIFKHFLLLLSILFLCVFMYFFISFFYKSGIDKSTEWSTIPVCLSLTCFCNRGDTEGTNSSKNNCLMFVV